MAGERLSKLTIEVSLAFDDQERAKQTDHIQLKLAGVWRDYYRGQYTAQRQFLCPDPDPADAGRDYVKKAVENWLALVKFDIQSYGLAYVVSAVRDLGNTPSTTITRPNGLGGTTTITVGNIPRIQFDIEATQYSTVLDLDFRNLSRVNEGFLIVQRLTTLQPLSVSAVVLPTGIYGSADGTIYLSATGGNTRPLSYVWADDPTATTDTRQHLKAGTYTCTVRDSDGVTATATCVVASDPQLHVTVQQTEDSITLTISGGVAPYTVAWDDGPTSLVRTGLAYGTYKATVTDDHGASQRVEATLLSNQCYFSRNPVRLALDAGAAYRADPTTKPNLSFVAELWVEQDYRSGTFTQLGPQLEQPADLQGRTVFDVQALLETCVREHLPALTGSLAAPATGLFTRFYLKSAQKYGTPPVVQALATAQVHVVLCGGLAPAEAAAGTWPAYQAEVKPFLTWEPAVQRVLPTQPYFLYYQHVTSATTAKVWVRTLHLDGSSSAAAVATLTDLHRWEVYCLRVGPAALGLTGATVAGYQVWVADAAGTVIAATRRFVLERAYYLHPRFLLYTNSLGGVNVLTALGAGKLALEVKASEAPRPAYDPALGDVATLDRVGTPTLSLGTGPRRRAQLVADQDLLLSRRVTLQAGGAYWPGRVAANTYTLRDEAAGLQSLTFDFVLAGQRHFSPRLPAVVAGQLTPPVAGGEGAQP